MSAVETIDVPVSVRIVPAPDTRGVCKCCQQVRHIRDALEISTDGHWERAGQLCADCVDDINDPPFVRMRK